MEWQGPAPSSEWSSLLNAPSEPAHGHVEETEDTVFHTLNFLDEFSRECMPIRAKRKLNSTDVAEALQDCLRSVGIKPICGYPGWLWGVRPQRAVQRDITSGGSQCGAVHEDRAGTDRHQSMVQLVPPHPTAPSTHVRPPLLETILEKRQISDPETGGRHPKHIF